jgi:hypothetical protein
MKKNVYILTLVFIFSPLLVHAYTFTQTLSLGSDNQDVLELQKFLNTDSRTQVVQTGIGSIGNETTYFGQKTKDAVIKFQNLYAAEVLNPYGLTTGTGVVGPATRALLNLKQNQNTIGQISVPTNTATFSTSSSVLLQNTSSIENLLNNLIGTSTSTTTPQFYPLVTSSYPGEIKKKNGKRRFVDKPFTIGSHLKISDIDFYLGTNRMRKSCVNDYVCTVWINKNTKAGTYTLSTNQSELGTHEFKVVSMSVQYPQVNLVNNTIKITGDNLITGTNFTENMKVFTVLGMFETKTVRNSFILEIPNEFQIIENSVTGPFYIENSEGLRSNTIMATYEK